MHNPKRGDGGIRVSNSPNHQKKYEDLPVRESARFKGQRAGGDQKTLTSRKTTPLHLPYLIVTRNILGNKRVSIPSFSMDSLRSTTKCAMRLHGFLVRDGVCTKEKKMKAEQAEGPGLKPANQKNVDVVRTSLLRGIY